MSEAIIPSYRVRREASGLPWRMLGFAGGLLGLLAVGLGGWWAVERLSGPRTIPVIEADAKPFKVRPDDPGGLRVPNQDELILERPAQRAQAIRTSRSGGLGPEAESPDIRGLIAAVAPPPAAAPAPVAPAAVAPAAEPVAAPPPAAQTEAPAPAAPATAEPVRIPVSGRVQVQLGALVSEAAARSEWERLSRRAPELFEGRTPQIVRFDRDGQAPLWRLRTGGLPDLDTAREFCEQIRTRGGACMPVRS